MSFSTARLTGVVMLLLTTLAVPALATDVDGPNDCQRTPVDFGDAPEGVDAYPGVTGHFPTCLASTAAGDQTFACAPISSAPGLTGFVQHTHPGIDNFWLGCGDPLIPFTGIDDESDGKVNATGGATSACNQLISVDCVEAAFGMSFGQDEKYGSTDAGIAAAVAFTTCKAANVFFKAYSCATSIRRAYLNVLVDWNQDGDWNDNLACGLGCAYEWAVKNQIIYLQPGCTPLVSQTFRAGPNAGWGWMRITLSAGPTPDDFPWNGSAGMAGQALFNGETEDYPVLIQASSLPCPGYEDWGDAPENAEAYPGVPGSFPTCSAAGPVGTLDFVCTPLGTPPGPAGYVRHVAAVGDQNAFWLGCSAATGGVDGEADGKTNDTGGSPSVCAAGLSVDCSESLGMSYGQDECYGDGVDAGLDGPTLAFTACQLATVDFRTFNCKDAAVDVFLNILVDMNHDGDWNDNFVCSSLPGCAHEWAVRNVAITLQPGCEPHTSPQFPVGPQAGNGWLRITLTAGPVGDDFPWNGSAGPNGNGFFSGGETEDYPVIIQPTNVGVDDARDRGGLWLAPMTPNPGVSEVAVRFALPQQAEVSLAAYDVAGRKLADLAHGSMGPGEHHVTWNFRDADGREHAAGYYVIRLRVGDRVLTRTGVRVR